MSNPPFQEGEGPASEPGPNSRSQGDRHGPPEGAAEVTGRKRAEEALRASEEKYRSLFDSIDEGFCILQLIFDEEENALDYRYLEINRVFEEQTGLRDALGRTARELVPGLEDFWFETYGSVALTGEPRRFVNHAESLGRWFDVFAFRIGDPEERRVAVLFNDITERRQAEEEKERLLRELRVERSRLEYIFEQAPAFLAVVRGPDHVFELANAAYHRLIGRRQVIGKPVAEALPEITEQGFLLLLDRVLETGEPFVGREVPVRLARTPGAPLEQRFVDFSYLPIVEADGSRSGVIAHGTDVTEHVLARREIERLFQESEDARAEAESANRAKSEFLASMSHELRTPLNAIAGYVDLLDLGIHGEPNEAQRHTLSRIRANQRHLLALINDVLAFAKGQVGRIELDVRSLPVNEQLFGMEPLVAALAEAKGVDFTVEACDRELRILGDEERVRQVLLNVLDNAVKFTDEGGWVRLSAEAAGDWTDIHVADSGPGISPEHQSRIFDPFVQAGRRLDRPQEGVGLGLAISRDLARAMGGELFVESEPGEGSTFTLRLARHSGDGAG